MSVSLQQFLQTFYEEAAEHLANMESGLLELEAGSNDELLNSIFRCAHSIKGASGTFGLTEVARFTHTLENLLDRLRNKQLPVTAPLVDLLLRATDCLRSLIAASQGKGGPAADVELVLKELVASLGVEEKVAEKPLRIEPIQQKMDRIYAVDFTPDVDLMLCGSDPLLLLRELTDLGEVLSCEVDTSRLPHLKQLHPHSCYLSWRLRIRTDHPEAALSDVFSFVMDSCRLTISQQPDAQASGLANPPVRVMLEQANDLFNVCRDLLRCYVPGSGLTSS